MLSVIVNARFKNMFAHCLTIPLPLLRSCFSLFIFLSLFLSLSSLSFLCLCFLPLCFLLCFLFSRSWPVWKIALFCCVLSMTEDRASCISMEDSIWSLSSSIVVPFPFLVPERSSFFNDFPHGWLLTIRGWVLQQKEKHYPFKRILLVVIDLFIKMHSKVTRQTFSWQTTRHRYFPSRIASIAWMQDSQMLDSDARNTYLLWCFLIVVWCSQQNNACAKETSSILINFQSFFVRTPWLMQLGAKTAVTLSNVCRKLSPILCMKSHCCLVTGAPTL